MIYLFSPPERIADEEKYVFEILDRVTERQDLGELLRLSYWVEGRMRYFVAVFEKGRVEGQFELGKAGIAKVIRKGRRHHRRHY